MGFKGRRSLLLVVVSILLTLAAAWLSEVSENSALFATYAEELSSPTQGDALLSLGVPAEPLEVGEGFSVTVKLSQLSARLSAFQFDLSYDPDVIAYTGAFRGDFLGSTGRAVVCPAPVQVTTNTVRIACASTGEGNGPTGAGELMVLYFTALNDGNSTLAFGNALLADDERPPSAIGVSTQASSVSVGRQKIYLPLVLRQASLGRGMGFTLEPTPTPTEEAEGPSTEGDKLHKLYLPLIIKSRALPSQGGHNPTGGLVPIVLGLPLLGIIAPRLRRRGRRKSFPWHKLLSLLIVLSFLVGLLPPPVPAQAASPASASASKGAVDPLTGLPLHPMAKALSKLPARAWAANGSFWADIDGDRDVDETDLAAAADYWNCAKGSACYDADLDKGGFADLIDAFDLAYLGSEYDVEPPDITIQSPAEGALLGETSVQVSGVVSDKHGVAWVTVNGVTAAVSGGTFQATVSVAAGNQTINVIAADALGKQGTVSRLVFVDREGPIITVNSPKPRQTAYSLRPTIAISYTDYYTGVNPSTFQATLTDKNGNSTDISSYLTAGATGAGGQIGFDLTNESVYTLTVSVQDALGNTGTATAAFYVVTGVTPPTESPDAGWVSGVIYDSGTCKEVSGQIDLMDCKGIAGARVTLEKVNTLKLAQARAERAARIAATGDTRPTPVKVDFATAVQGTVVTGPDGFFAFPVSQTGHYAIRVEKDGFTYGQRMAEIVKERNSAVNEIYLTPIDSAQTTCSDAGCSHTSADGQMQVEIPAGAIQSGQVVTVTATEFDRVNFLPSGELPPGTWETYAFNLGGDSSITFTKPITVRIKNSRGFPPGTEIPVGYWNDQLLQWEHAGTAVVDSTGAWLVMEVTHFSNFDPNAPVSLAALDVDLDGQTGADGTTCAEDPCGSEVTLRSGRLRQTVVLPPVQALDEPMGLAFKYDSGRADPMELIEADINLDLGPGVEVGDYIQAELYIEGQKTAEYTFKAPDITQGGNIGRFRFLWDGRDAQGNRLPPGIYRYALRVRIPYRSQYYASANGRFGGPPDYSRPLGVWAAATADRWLYGSVTLDADPGSPFGMGWSLVGQQRLYEDEAGRILIDDGNNGLVEFYFPGKNLLRNSALMLQAHEVTGLHGLYVPDIAASHRSPEGGEGLLLPLTPPPLPPDDEQGEVLQDPASVSMDDLVYGPEAPPAPVSITETDPPEKSGPTSRKYRVPGKAAPRRVRAETAPNADNVSGVIVTNTTWTKANSPYILTGDVVVTQGVTLTIEPGVEVKGDDNTELKILGHLEAVGTAAEPVTFTSSSAVDDPSTWWRGIFFDGGTGNLKHVTVSKWHGDARAGIVVQDVLTGQVRIESGAFGPAWIPPNYYWETYGLFVKNSHVVVSDTLFANIGNTGPGVRAQYAAIRAYGNQTVITVTNSTIRDNFAGMWDVAGIYGEWSADIRLSNTTFQNNQGAPIRVDSIVMHHALSSTNTFQGNTPNRMLIWGGGMAESVTFYNNLDGYEFQNSHTVPQGITLTIQPGVAVLGQDEVELKVQGHLEAVGTPTRPITFTSSGDPNNPYQWWKGIFFDGGTGNLKHAVVSRWYHAHYDNQADADGCEIPSGPCHIGNVNAGIAVRDVVTGMVRIESSTIRDGRLPNYYTGRSYGLTVDDSRVVVSDTLFTNIGATGSDYKSYGDFSIAAWGDQTVLTVTLSTFQANPGGGVEFFVDWGARASLRNSTFRDNGDHPIWAVFSTMDTLLDGTNVFVNNAGGAGPGNIYLMGGTLPDNATLYDNGVNAYVLTGDRGDYTIPQGTTLIAQPGVRVDGFTKGFVVQGTLRAVGTEEERILFTSHQNSDRNQWDGIRVDGGQLEMQYATVRYAGTGIQVSNNGSAFILASTIVTNTTGIHVTGSKVNVLLSSIYGNSDYGVRNDTDNQVDARYNWWGSSTGPTHPSNPNGTGDRVSDNVFFDPWLRQKGESLRILNGTPWDDTTLTYDQPTGTYTRHYPDGTVVHFNADGTHDYTLDPMGNKLRYVYNADGTLARVEFIPAGWTGEAPWKWNFSYRQAASSGRVGILSAARSVVITDPAGRSTTFTLNEHGDLVSILQPGWDQPMTFAYDGRHRMTQKQDERGYVTTYEYNAKGRLSKVILPPREIYDPATDTFKVEQEVRQYAPSDVSFQLVNEIEPGNPITPTVSLVKADAITDTVQVGDAKQVGQTDRWGNPIAATDPLGRQVRMERDEAGRITRIVRPDGACVEYTYDEKGNMLTETLMPASECAKASDRRDPAKLQVTAYTYELELNRLTSVTDPLGQKVSFTYDDKGLLVQVTHSPITDVNGTVITPTETFEYNAWGQLTKETDANGVATCYVYTQGTADEAAGGSNPLFASGVTPVPGLLTQVKEDCGGPQEQVTTYKEFDAAGNPQLVVLPSTGVRQMRAAYDSRSRVISETNPIGVVTSYEYDNADNLTRLVEDATGEQVTTEYSYDALGQLVGLRVGRGSESVRYKYGYDKGRRLAMEQDARGYRTRYFYNAAGQLERIVDALGNAVAFAYDAYGRLLSETDPRGVVTRYEYDELGREKQIIQDYGGLNVTTSFEYDKLNRVVVETDPRGVRTCTTYDAFDRAVKVVEDCGGLNATTSYAYDAVGNLVAETDPRGNTTRYGYDRLGRLTVITDALGYATHYEYDAADNQTAITDPLGRTTRFTYDAGGRATVITDPAGNTMRATYDAFDRITSLTDPRGFKTYYTYDFLGRNTRIVNPLGGTTTYEYDADGNLAAVTDALGRTTRYTYDGMDRLTAFVDPAGNTTTYAYDGAGNRISETDPLGSVTRYGYDALNRVAVITDAIGAATTFTYDASGNLIRTTDPAGGVQQVAYDSLGHTVAVTESNGSVTRMAYDLNGNLTQVTDPNGNATTFAYDALNRLTTETNALGKSRTYAYDAVGNVTAYTDRLGRQIKFTYDALDNLVKEEWVGAGRVITYTYDAASFMTAARDPDSFYRMTYDGIGNNTSVDNTGTPGMPGVVISYTYDVFGNVTAVSEMVNGHPKGVTEYVYDALNQPIRITQHGSGVSEKRIDLTYNALGLLTGLKRYRDLNGNDAVVNTTFSYDGAARLLQTKHTLAGGLERTYVQVLDNLGRPTQRTMPDGTATYTHDAFGQVTAVDYSFQDDEAYTYDSAGNRTGSGYVVGTGNRLLSDGTYDYEYDDEGNLIRRTEKATGAKTEYTWDYRNRLTNVVFKDGGGAVTKSITYTYDVFDRRIGVAVDPDGSGPQGVQVERFVYDGLDITLAFDGSGDITHRYLYGPFTDMPLAEERVGSDVLWLLQDWLGGNVVDVVDNTGSLKNHIVYDAFGNIRSQSNASYMARFAYAGRDWDAEAGLYYYRARYYNPRIGRFISEDPAGLFGGDANLYRYVLNSPTRYTDPDGLGWFSYYTRKFLRAADKFTAGFADAITFGLTTKIRKSLYGRVATRNHKGGLFIAGQVVGTAVSIVIPAAGQASAVKAAKLIKQSKATMRYAQKLAAQSRKMAQRYMNVKAVPPKVLKDGMKLAKRSNFYKKVAKETLRDAAKYRFSTKLAAKFSRMQQVVGAGRIVQKAISNDPCDPLSLTDFLVIAAPFIGSKAKAATQWLKTKTHTLWNRAKDYYQLAYDRLKGTTQRITQNLSDAFQSANSYIRNLMSKEGRLSLATDKWLRNQMKIDPAKLKQTDPGRYRWYRERMREARLQGFKSPTERSKNVIQRVEKWVQPKSKPPQPSLPQIRPGPETDLKNIKLDSGDIGTNLGDLPNLDLSGLD